MIDNNNPRNLPSGTVTFLFTDVQGSTMLLRALGERYPVVMARQRQVIGDAAAAEGGVIVDTEGDGTFLSFPSPTGGIAAALAAQLELASTEWDHDHPVRVRMGLHTGEASVINGDYIGLAVHEAARIASSGHGGQIVVSDLTAGMVGGSLPPKASLQDMGEHLLKDFPSPLRIHQLNHPGLESSFPPLKATSRRAYNLPAQLTSFIGREDEIAAITELLAAHRLVTLIGTVGCGKTRLAFEVAGRMAERFAGGVWVVDLSAATGPAQVGTLACAALGVDEVAGRTTTELVVERLAERNALLVLDKCEHVVGACAQLAEAVLRGCPSARILVTGREVLDVAGEMAWSVPGLELPPAGALPPLNELADYEAVRLFVERAQAVEPAFRLTESDGAHVVQVCRRLDGIPMAIELAAARVKALDIAGIAARLDDRFRLLAGGGGRGAEGQQTMRAAFDWSHDLLTEPERLVFRRVGVFCGSFNVAAVEVVATGDGVARQDIPDVLARLVGRSLVAKEWTAAGIRYRQLETIRSYALERLADAAETVIVRHRHLRWVQDLAAEVWEATRAHRSSHWAERLDGDAENIRLAMDWAMETRDGRAALEILRGVGQHWFDNGRLRELEERTAIAVSLDPDAPVELRAWAMAMAASVSQVLGDLEAARGGASRALALAQSAGDDWDMAKALTVQACVAQNSGNRGQARATHQEAFALHRRAGNDLGVAASLSAMADLDLADGNRAGARAKLEEALAITREGDDTTRMAEVLLSLAEVTRAEGDLAGARALQAEALDAARTGGKRRLVAQCCLSLALLEIAVGDLPTATSWADQALAIGEETGDRLAICRAWFARGVIACDRGDAPAARAAFETAGREGGRLGEWVEDEKLVWLAITDARAGAPARGLAAVTQVATGAAARGDRALAGLARHAIGRFSLSVEDLVDARQELLASLDLLRADGAKGMVALGYLGLGFLQLAEGEGQLAATSFGRAIDDAAAMGHQRVVAEALDGLASAAVALGDHERAARYFGVSSGIRQRMGVTLLDGDAARIAGPTAETKKALGARTFNAQLKKGAALTLAEAVALVRG